MYALGQMVIKNPQPNAYDAPAPPLRHIGKYDAFGAAPHNIPHTREKG